MAFKLSFSTDNDLFREYGLESAIKRILDKVGYKITRGMKEGAITDEDGNQLGQFTLSEDDD